MRNKHKALLSIALGALLHLGPAHLQANAVWVGNTTGAGTLDIPANWSGDTLPTSSTIAEFGPAGTAGTSLPTVSGFTSLGVLFDSTAPAYYLYNDVTDIFSIGLSGVVNNSTHTQQIANDSSGAGLILFAGGSAGTNMEYTSGNTTTGGGITFQSSTDGSGSTFGLTNSSTLTTNGNSSVGSLNVDVTSNVVIASGSLTTGSLNGDDYVYGVISGPGGLILSTTTTDGYLGLSGINTYEGGTVVNAFGDAGLYTFDGGTFPTTDSMVVNSGTLFFGTSQAIGSLSGIGGVVALDPAVALTVNQTANQTYAGTITGAAGTSFTLGTLGSTSATGILQLTGNSNAFAGAVAVNSGNLQVNGNFGASGITVNSGGTISGKGTFGTLGNTTTITAGGTLSPGNSVGTITNAGNQVFNAGSIFRLEQNGFTTGPVTPSTDLLIVNGTAVVNAATVNLVTTDGLINFNTKQTFLTAAGGLTVNNGGFTANTAGLFPLFNPQAFTSALTFDANNYYILNQTQFASEAALNDAGSNAIAVGAVIDSIADPTTAQNFLLNGLAQLPSDDLVDVLDDLSGAQYASEGFIAEVANRQFIRRLYDPLRAIVTTEPSCECDCEPVDPCCDSMGINVWAEAGGGQRKVNGRLGFTLNEWDVTLGVQKTFDRDWTVGIAGSYEHHSFDHHLNGSGKGFSWFGGLYGLYRPSNYYVLADLAYGYTEHEMHRHIFVGDFIHLHGKPSISQVTFYAEAGLDYNFCSFLIQPFVGIEVAGFHRNRFSEIDELASELGLTFHKKDRTLATSSLGVHLTDKFNLGFNVSVDLAWLYRFTTHNDFGAHFDSFGTGFTGHGEEIGRSSGEGAITFSKDFENSWRVYVEASGEVWSRASVYNVLGGVQFTW